MRTLLSTLDQIKNLQENETQRFGVQHSKDFHMSKLFQNCTPWFLAFPTETNFIQAYAKNFNEVGWTIGPISANTHHLVAGLGLSTTLGKLHISLQ